MTFSTTLRTIAAGVIAVAGGLAAPAAAEYPEKPVTFILPNGAGGAADINLRIILNHLEEIVPARLVVKNITGGATATGTRAAYDAPKDGYTLLFFHQAFMGTAAQGILGREFTDMVPVARAGSIDIMYAAARDAPFDTLPELIEYATENPGAVRVGVFLRAHSHMVALKVMQDPELRAELGQRIIDLEFKRGEALQAEVDAQYATTVEIVERFGLATDANE